MWARDQIEWDYGEMLKVENGVSQRKLFIADEHLQ